MTRLYPVPTLSSTLQRERHRISEAIGRNVDNIKRLQRELAEEEEYLAENRAYLAELEAALADD